MKIRILLAEMERRAHFFEPSQALAAFRAVLTTLAELMPSRDALALSMDLPVELRSFILSPPYAHGDVATAHEFLTRVAKREGVNLELASLHTRIALGLLSIGFSAETRAIVSELPRSYRPWFEPLPRDFGLEESPQGQETISGTASHDAYEGS